MFYFILNVDYVTYQMIYQNKCSIGIQSGCFTIKKRTWYSILKTETTFSEFTGMHFQFHNNKIDKTLLGIQHMWTKILNIM